MARTRLKAMGRRDSGGFAAIPHHILESQEYAALSPASVKLLLDLFGQFRGSNNGDFTAAWSVMKKRGWRSKATLHRALTALLEKGWLEKTRQGGKHKCCLYAVTWLQIHDCGGKLDVYPSRMASNKWKQQNKNAPPIVGHIGTETVPISRTGTEN